MNETFTLPPTAEDVLPQSALEAADPTARLSELTGGMALLPEPFDLSPEQVDDICEQFQPLDGDAMGALYATLDTSWKRDYLRGPNHEGFDVTGLFDLEPGDSKVVAQSSREMYGKADLPVDRSAVARLRADGALKAAARMFGIDEKIILPQRVGNAKVDVYNAAANGAPVVTELTVEMAPGYEAVVSYFNPVGSEEITDSMVQIRKL